MISDIIITVIMTSSYLNLKFHGQFPLVELDEVSEEWVEEGVHVEQVLVLVIVLSGMPINNLIFKKQIEIKIRIEINIKIKIEIEIKIQKHTQKK